MHTDYDVAIAGGGMVGAGLACALAGSALRVALIEAVPPASVTQPSYDDRGLSLSLTTARILAAIDAWPALAGTATPVEHVHVSDRGHFGFVRLHAADLDLFALGYVVVARELGSALMDRLGPAGNVDFHCPARVTDIDAAPDRVELQLVKNQNSQPLSCRLLVVADGGRSDLRDRLGIEVTEKDYGQTAIVANVSAERGHANWAFERFTRDGPVALLPLPDQRCASVCTVASDQAEACMDLDDKAYLELLQSRFGRRLGRFTRVGTRKAYPVFALQPAMSVQHRALLLGNAAHTVHPNAGQGFNLGLRDAAGLAEILLESETRDAGDPELLQSYLALRRQDQQRVVSFTDRLASLFYNDDPARILARDAGMLLTDLVPGFKRAFIRRAMGSAGRQPAMARAREDHGY